MLGISNLANIPPKANAIGWRSFLSWAYWGVQDFPPISPGIRDYPDTFLGHPFHPLSGNHDHIVRNSTKIPSPGNVPTCEWRFLLLICGPPNLPGILPSRTGLEISASPEDNFLGTGQSNFGLPDPEPVSTGSSHPALASHLSLSWFCTDPHCLG